MMDQSNARRNAIVGVAALVAVAVLVVAGVVVFGADADTANPPVLSATPEPSTPPEVAAFTAPANGPDVVAAAAGLARLPQAMLYADPDEMAVLLGDATTTGAGIDDLNDVVITELGPLRRALVQATPNTTWFAVQPFTVEVMAQTDTTASVRVWTLSVFSRQGVADPEIYGEIVEMDLVLVNGTWRIDAYRSARGPTPRPGVDEMIVSARELDSILADHRLIPTTNPT